MEPVLVVDAFGHSQLYPDVSDKTMEVSLGYINKSLGLDLDPSVIQGLLNKMQIKSEAGSGEGQLTLRVPPTRSDVLHACTSRGCS